MLDFIKKYISLVNKNNILEIQLGRQVSKNIFKTELEKSVVEEIITNLKKRYTKIKTTNYINNIKFKGCETIEIINKKVTYSYITINEYFISDAFIMQNKLLNVDKTLVPSYANYDREGTLEVLDMVIHNIIIRIEKNNSYNMKLIVNKPCKIDKLVEILNIINYS